MILSDVLARFARDPRLSMMTRGVMENAINPTIVDPLFEDVAERRSARKVLFSSVVDLMSVLCRIAPHIHAADQAETIDDSIKVVCDKLHNTEPALAAALVPSKAERPGPPIDARDGARDPPHAGRPRPDLRWQPPRRDRAPDRTSSSRSPVAARSSAFASTPRRRQGVRSNSDTRRILESGTGTALAQGRPVGAPER
jgi:hypothetical protein